MLLLGCVMFVLLTASQARAQTASTETIPNHPALSDKFVFELGGYYSTSATAASLGPSGGGTGVVVDFENTLGLEDQNWSAVGGFMWRFSERWRLEVDYFSLNRSATRTLGESINWGDNIFPAGSTVTSSYDFSDIRLGVGYSFFKRRDKELGVGFGLHVAGIETSIATSTGSLAESTDVTAPLPVFNFFGTFALTDEWAVRMRLDWLSLNYDIYSGDVRNVAVDVLYQPFRNVGFGFGLRNLVFDVEIDDTEWHGKARTTFTGPTLFMRVSF
jgi:hypothetical protein